MAALYALRMLPLATVIAASASEGEPLWVVLLIGGGLGVLGTLVGTLLSQTSAARLAGDARREGRRLSAKTFQRDTLVELQDSLLALHTNLDALRRCANPDNRAKVEARFRKTDLRVQMLAGRVRDDEFRNDVDGLLWSFRHWRNEIVGVEDVVPLGQRERKAEAESRNRDVSQRAGELIRTLDEAIDERA